jgi:hypothetical protein
MRNNIIAPLVLMLSFNVMMALKVAAQKDSGYGKVWFMRLPTREEESVLGMVLNYSNVFIDSNFVCKLDEKRYFIASVPVGMHNFDVQAARGKKIKATSNPIAFKVEEGKSYYIQFVFRRYNGARESYCKYLTEERAKMMLPDLKEDKSCYKDANQK